jgi:hypothetical protein
MKNSRVLADNCLVDLRKEDMHWHDLFVQLLKKEFQRQKGRNSKLSMRQWSKRIGISSGAVSEILGGRRKVTAEKAVEITTAARVPGADLKHLLAHMGTPSEVARIAPTKEDINLIRNWANHAICGLYELNSIKVDAKFIAARLGLSKDDVTKRTEILLRRGLLKKDEAGKVFRNKENWDLSLTLSPEELREVKKTSIGFAKWAIEKVPAEKSYFLAYTFPGNAAQIEFVQQEIKKLLNTLDAMAESEPRDELIRLSLQLFPFRFSDSLDSPEN